MQNIRPMDRRTIREEAASPATETASPAESGSTARRPYEPPRIERRIPIVANTLVSGSQCIFPGDPCDS
jgi:hypothetical protein